MFVLISRVSPIYYLPHYCSPGSIKVWFWTGYFGALRVPVCFVVTTTVPIAEILLSYSR